MNPESPNHALQRTAPCVTAPASAASFPPAMQVPRRTPPSLSLGSLGVARASYEPNHSSSSAFIAGLHVSAAEDPLIPTTLNAVLPKIHSGMSIREVEAALAPAYPNVKGRMGEWSGQTGYIDYKLDERYSLCVSSITRDGREVVHEEKLLLLYDWPSKRCLDIKVFEWEKQSDKKPSSK